MAVPSVAALSGGAKVVIIVGATEGTTASYRRDADEAYAAAIQYTSNVVKVYSPNATWARVKAAVAGASVVIYLGHGNGWPSPYTYDPQYKTKDGFGLNASDGAGDSNRQYYGEPYIATLDLAPGAIVILNHLCYASGNSEAGAPEPTVDVARQRVDNYASAFLKAGAAAVIADAHRGVGDYLRDLFTTSGSIESLWANQPAGNGNIVSFPSTRTPGATAYQDPQTPTSGFYRSLVVRSAGAMNDGLATGPAGDTSSDPGTLSIPGNASVASAAADLFGDPGMASAPVRSLPGGTRLRVIGQPGALSAQATPLVQVQGLDDPSIYGYVEVGNLAPRDSTPPALTGLDLGSGSISPNGDGIADQAVLNGQFSESADWTVAIADQAGNVLFQQSGSGPAFQVVWNPLAGGQPIPDGRYTVTVSAVDAWQNRRPDTRGQIAVDGSPSQLRGARSGRHDDFVLLSQRRRLSRHDRADGHRLRARLTRRHGPGRRRCDPQDLERGHQRRPHEGHLGWSRRLRCGRPRRPLRRLGRPGRRRRQCRQRPGTDAQPGRGVEPRLELGAGLLPAGSRLDGIQHHPLVHAGSPDDRDLDPPRRGWQGRRHDISRRPRCRPAPRPGPSTVAGPTDPCFPPAGISRTSRRATARSRSRSRSHSRPTRS